MFRNFSQAFTKAQSNSVQYTNDKRVIDLGFLLYSGYNVLKTSYDDMWSYVENNPDLFFGINFKLSALFSNSWYIDTVEGVEKGDAEVKQITELMNIIDKLNGRDRTFTQTLMQCIAEQMLMGLSYLERTQNNYFYIAKTGNVVPNFNEKGILKNMPYIYISDSGVQQEMPPGAIIKIDGVLLKNGTTYDLRQLLPMALLNSILSVLQSTDYARYYQVASFKNGIFPSSVIKMPEGKSLEDTEEFLQYLLKRYSIKSGSSSAFKQTIKSYSTGQDIELEIPWGAPLMLPGGYDIKDGINMKDLNFQELLDYSERKIFEVLQIPEIIAGARKNGSIGNGKEFESAIKSYHENTCNAEKEYYSDLLTLRLFKQNENYIKNNGNGIRLSDGTTDLSMYRFVFPKRKFKEDFQMYMLVQKAYELGALTMRAYKENLKPMIEMDDMKYFTEEQLNSTYKPAPAANPFGDMFARNPVKPDVPDSHSETVADDADGIKCAHRHTQTIVPHEMTYRLKADKPVKIYNAAQRNYTKIDLQDKALEKETITALYNVIYGMVSKYAADVRKSYIENNGYNAKELTKIKLKDKNLLNKDFKAQLEKGWSQGREQIMEDLNAERKTVTKEYEEPGAWDYSQVDAIIDLIVAARGGKVSQDLVTRLQNEIKNAIRADIPIDDLVASMMNEGPEGILDKIRKYIETEARTALREVNAQSRYDAAVNSIGAEYIQIDATLDASTTDICKKLNGYIFPADKIPQFGLPPYHWNCRTTINSIFAEDVQQAIDEVGGNNSPLNNDPSYAADVAREMNPEFRN